MIASCFRWRNSIVIALNMVAYKIAAQIFGLQFKKRAPRAVKAVRSFATKQMVRPFKPTFVVE